MGAAFDTDVVIVGAGPVGLATACALAHHGVSFRIFERAPGISGASKGHNAIARAQELLDAIGVREPVASKSYVAPFTQYMLDGRPIHRQSTRDLPSPYPDVLFSNQGTIEEVLSERLERDGIRVEHAHEVRGIDQDDDSVTVTVVPLDDDGDPNGEAKEVRCRYLVGANGVKGNVRQAVGLDFEAQDLPGWAIRQIDGTLTWRRPIECDTAFFFLIAHGLAGVLPVWQDQYRLFLLEDESAMPARDPTREEMVARGREVTGDASFDIADPSWFSYGTFRHGVAPGYAAGRVFLVGDAAHANLPIGGQGMNSGFIDAVSLGWRLAMVLDGAATPTLLDSYAEERKAANDDLGAQQVRGFRELMERGRAADAVLGAVANVVPQVADYVFGGSDLAQLGLAYRNSRLSEDRFLRLDPRFGAILHVLYAEADKTLAGVAGFLSDPARTIEQTLAAMMATPHLGEAGVHPVVASAARELLNKSDNERSGVLSTAMSFLGLYRDPVVAQVTRACQWRISDLVEGDRPATLYLVVPPSDISRTKPLIRLILNQIGRRLTEELTPKGNRHRVLLMLDEFPALGRLDFFESALAFMAGYGLKAFLIAQSLNQIEKAYGPNNAILDNCHVRVSFATNDERTAKRVSDALGTATEMRAMKNYAGHRLSPWLGHLMVSRSETARQLLTPGEVMQLPPDDEIVMVAGVHPIRAKKARYFQDRRLSERIVQAPAPEATKARADDWTGRQAAADPKQVARIVRDAEDVANGGLRREPELPEHVAVAPETTAPPAQEFAIVDDEQDDAARQAAVRRRMQGLARQASLNPGDGIDL